MNNSFEDQLNKYGFLVYTNVGDSMLPLRRENRELMVIQRKGIDRCKKYEAVLYRRTTGQYVMHRILKVREHDYVLCGDNRWQRETGVTDSQILGVMTAIIRDGKEHRVTSAVYRLYVHLWCDFFWIRAFVLHIKAMALRIVRKYKT